jgi:hypothetical protein
MKRLSFIVVLILLFALTTSIAVAQKGEDKSSDQEGNTEAISVTCYDDNGNETSSFDNGVEVTVVQMRSGFEYTATVLGIGEFDPILAIFNDEGDSLCIDDSAEAMAYTADLPSSGGVEASSFNPQLIFNNGAEDEFADVSLVVGGYNSMPGEFLLILEGMAVTAADNAGDPFSVHISDQMVASEAPVTVYAIADTDSLDPLIRLINTDYETILDEDGAQVYCDDAGSDSLCWSGAVDNLDGSYVDIANGEFSLAIYDSDAILSIPLDADYAGGYFNFLVTSYEQSTYGDYTMVFHIGVGEQEPEDDKADTDA